MNLNEGLAREIQRVAESREQFKQLRSMPNVIVEPQIEWMTRDLDKAQAAMGSGDIAEMMRAYNALKEWGD